MIYPTLISTTCVKIRQISCIIFEIKSHFSRRNSPVFFLAQTLHTFYESSPSKCKFSDFPLLWLKCNKFLMSFFKQKVSFSSKFGSFSSVERDNSSIIFQLKIYMLLRKVAYQSASFQTCHFSYQNSSNSSCHFWNQESVFLQTLHHSSVS